MANQLVEQLDLNDLLYIQGTDASVADNKQLRKFYPEKVLFKNDEKILFTVHGRQFINFKNSSLKFRVKFLGSGGKTATGTKGGSILNLFKRTRILSSTGKSISDLDNLNLYNRMSTRIYRGRLHNILIGTVYGLKESGGDSLNTWVANTEYEYVIPLRFLSPFLDTEQLCPPQIGENMRIELFLENLIRVGVIDNPGEFTGYEVLNPELILEVIKVTPSIDSAVSSMSNDKMVYEFCDVVQVEGSMSVNSGDLRLPLTYPLSNALECFTTIRLASVVNDPEDDSFRTIPIGVNNANFSTDDQFLMRVGQIQLPQARAIGGGEIYNLFLNGRNQLCCNANPDIDMDVKNFQEEINSWAHYFCNLRRSCLFENSGREVSNQQALVAEIKIKTPSNNIANLFCKYVGRVVIENNYLRVES